MGKGDTPRPIEVDWEIFERNWNEVFGIDVSNRSSDGANNSDSPRKGDCGGAQHSTKDEPAK